MKVRDVKEHSPSRMSDSVRSIVYALVIAVIIRSLLFQPFNIPSGSMEPTLLIGDYLFVSKFSYGYTHYSFPLSPPIFSGRIFPSQPNRGDIVVFRLPRDDSIDYVKRVIGLPGDRIQIKNGTVHINDTPVVRQQIADFVGEDPCGGRRDFNSEVRVRQWQETLPNGVSYHTLQCTTFEGFPDTTKVYKVPPANYFMMGDNRENSEDSRFPDVGFVPFENVIGRAQIIFFSLAGGDPAWQIWRWPWSLRFNRLFKIVR